MAKKIERVDKLTEAELIDVINKLIDYVNMHENDIQTLFDKQPI